MNSLASLIRRSVLATAVCTVGTSIAADASFETDHYTGSARCAQCHDGLTDTAGNDISIVKGWSTSMMANSTFDPYWRAKVAAELLRNPSVSDEINDKCSRCHAPMANDAAKKDGADIAIHGDGFLSEANPYHNEAMDGVSCSLCHQISDSGVLGTLEGSSGAFVVEQQASRVDRPAYGQYPDPFTNPMQTNVEFTPQQGSHVVKSELCGTCHDLKTPFVNAQGEVATTTQESEFPEQMVYSEWKNSSYAVEGAGKKECQSCHMPLVDGAVKIAARPARMIEPREGFRLHGFKGANTTMLAMLDDNRNALGVTATGFDTAIADTREMLKTAGTIQITKGVLADGQLELDLQVTNTSGHKLPSGYPSRRVFIHLVARDADTGEVVFESGKLNADGSIEGADNDVDNKTFEPHYDIITEPGQVQIYEPIMVNTDDEVTHTLLRAARYIKDNRLTPAGFDKQNAPNDVAVKGAAMSDEDFNSGSDTVTYRFPVGDKTSLNIEATLVYQSLSYGHLQDLFDEAENSQEVAQFKQMFDTARIRAEDISTAKGTVTKETGLEVDTGDVSETPEQTDGGSDSGGGALFFTLFALLPFFTRRRYQN